MQSLPHYRWQQLETLTLQRLADDLYRKPSQPLISVSLGGSLGDREFSPEGAARVGEALHRLESLRLRQAQQPAEQSHHGNTEPRRPGQ